MSYVATKWAWDTDIQPHLKYILLALAHFHSGKTGQCNPKVETIAKMVGKSKRATQTALGQLEDMGYIAKAKRRRGPRQASNHYNLALDGVVFQSAPDRSLKTSKLNAELHPETTLGCTLYTEPYSSNSDTPPSKVVSLGTLRRG